MGLLDYLIVTSDTVGQGFKQLARYLRLLTVSTGCESATRTCHALDPPRVGANAADPGECLRRLVSTVGRLRADRELCYRQIESYNHRLARIW